MERKIIREQFSYLEISEFRGEFNLLVEKLQALRDSAKEKGYFDLQIEEDYDYESTNGFDVRASRYETEAEVIKREAKALKAKETKAKKSRSLKEQNKQKKYEEYLKLKKEFEG